MELTLTGSSHHYVYHEAGLACTAILNELWAQRGDGCVFISDHGHWDTPVWPFLLWACEVAEVSGLPTVWLLAGSWAPFPGEPSG